MQDSILIENTIQFAKDIIPIYNKLRSANHHYIADQLFRSALSVGANIHEAQAAESKKDFIHKFKITNKEIWETRYWFKIRSGITPIPQDLERERLIIHKMINKSIQTVLKNLAEKTTTNHQSLTTNHQSLIQLRIIP